MTYHLDTIHEFVVGMVIDASNINRRD